VTGHDYRAYSLSIKQALMLGLFEAGMEVHDIGLALSPVAYFAQFALDIPCVAMVTASHNENGWTGVKMGSARPLTFGPDEMGRLKDIVLSGVFNLKSGGAYEFVENLAERYVADLTDRPKWTRRMKVVAACGNGTAGAFAPRVLAALGADVVPLDTELDFNFPRYNPNPEDMQMLHAIAAAVRDSHADVGLGFDGDGDRCGVVDNTGEEIFADKVGARPLRPASERHIRRRREVDRPLRHRPGAQGERRRDRLLENRPFLHQAPRQRAQGARRIREIRPLFLQCAHRARLRRRHRLGYRRPRHAGSQPRQVDGRSRGRVAQDLGFADDVGALSG
jgi:hypothetical protein